MTTRTISIDTARRLAVVRQRLADPPRSAPATADDVVDVVRDLGCVQLDPISVVARSHQIVLWSRLGAFPLAELDRAMWDERRLFEYWAHVASIVLTEDYPLHNLLMRRYGTGDRPRHERLRAWLAANDELRRSILREIRRRGPVRARDLEDRAKESWKSSGWTAERNVDRMLDYLWTRGTIVVVGRTGIEKWWDFASRWFPDWTPRKILGEREVERRAAVRALRALGVATPQQISQHFLRGRYPHLKETLGGLERKGDVERVVVRGNDGAALPGTWLVDAEDVPLLERLASEDGDGWRPRTTLLSPFDNLICDRARTEMLFGFRYRVEIYTPAARREYGYYVLPILHGDRLIGRVDPALDRRRGVLRFNAVHAEPGAPRDRATVRAIRDAIADLATHLGAGDVEMPATVPRGWSAIRG